MKKNDNDMKEEFEPVNLEDETTIDDNDTTEQADDVVYIPKPIVTSENADEEKPKRGRKKKKDETAKADIYKKVLTSESAPSLIRPSTVNPKHWKIITKRANRD